MLKIKNRVGIMFLSLAMIILHKHIAGRLFVRK